MLIICGLGLWFVGILHKDIVLMPASIALILICLAMVACVVFGAAAVTYKWKNTHFSDAAFRIEANYPKKTGIDFKIFPFPFIEVTWDWEYPAEVEAETDEIIERKRKYQAEFLKYLKPKKVYYAFDFAGDKISKIDGTADED